jgi:hypothetical protein
MWINLPDLKSGLGLFVGFIFGVHSIKEQIAIPNFKHVLTPLMNNPNMDSFPATILAGLAPRDTQWCCLDWQCILSFVSFVYQLIHNIEIKLYIHNLFFKSLIPDVGYITIVCDNVQIHSGRLIVCLG